MSYACGSKYLYLQKYEDLVHHFVFVPRLCKSWSCPHCRKIKAAQLAKYIQEHFKSKTVYFTTFTYYHSGNPEVRWKELGKTWNRFRTYFTKFYTKFSFIRIIEPHHDGKWPHVHVLSNEPILTKLMAKKLSKWGFGWKAEMKSFELDRAASYITKYLTKEWPPGDSDYYRKLTRSRIISVSSDFPPVNKKRSDWECIYYDSSSLSTEYYCNSLIGLLLQSKATHISCRPMGGGFYIISDKFITVDRVVAGIDNHAWRYVDGYKFDYYPYGLQEKLPF